MPTALWRRLASEAVECCRAARRVGSSAPYRSVQPIRIIGLTANSYLAAIACEKLLATLISGTGRVPPETQTLSGGLSILRMERTLTERIMLWLAAARYR